jgi:hypothetical protein
MFITEDFVYIHVPKTGGTFVTTALRKLFDAIGEPYIDSSIPEGRKLIDSRNQHDPVNTIPTAHRDKPVVFTVRSPYDHYASLYEFAWWKREPRDEFDQVRVGEIYSSYPELSFSDFLLASNDVRVWPKAERTRGSEMERYGIGLITWRLITMLAIDPDDAFDHFCRFERSPFRPPSFPILHALRTQSLTQDLLEFLWSRGIRPEETAFIEDLGRIYPPEGGRDPSIDWRSYYDADLKKLVQRLERYVFACWPEFDV